jgi:hypothetical protein
VSWGANLWYETGDSYLVARPVSIDQRMTRLTMLSVPLCSDLRCHKRQHRPSHVQLDFDANHRSTHTDSVVDVHL